MFRNTYLKKDIPVAASMINFYDLYSLLAFCLIDFIEAEFLNLKHSSENI